MAVAKTKEPTVVEETETEVTVDDSAFVDKVTAIVLDLFKKNGPPAVEGEEPAPEGEPAKRMSLRDEEEHTRSLVAEAIAQFKKESPPEKEGGKETATETVPGKATIRKIEAWLWGKE